MGFLRDWLAPRLRRLAAVVGWTVLAEGVVYVALYRPPTLRGLAGLPALLVLGVGLVAGWRVMRPRSHEDRRHGDRRHQPRREEDDAATTREAPRT